MTKIKLTSSSRWSKLWCTLATWSSSWWEWWATSSCWWLSSPTPTCRPPRISMWSTSPWPTYWCVLVLWHYFSQWFIFIINCDIWSVSVPLTPLSTFMGRWVLGETLCKLFPSSQVRMLTSWLASSHVLTFPLSQCISVYMSTFTLTAIAVDRFLLPKREKLLLLPLSNIISRNNNI